MSATDVVAVIRGLQPHSLLQILPGLLVVAFCLTDLAYAAQVRYLPKWGWALACILSIPSAASRTSAWPTPPGQANCASPPPAELIETLAHDDACARSDGS